MNIKLIDLNPKFVDSYGRTTLNNLNKNNPMANRKGIGVYFDCPCGCKVRCYLPFKNPIDGLGDLPNANHTWERKNETMETLTLLPSIQRQGKCQWHGFLVNGEFKEC